MAITKEEFDKFEDGDTITVAFKDGDWRTKTTEIRVSPSSNGVHKWVESHGLNKYAEPVFSLGWNLLPGFGGRYYTLLEHIPKPKPAWHKAKVIKANGDFFLKHSVDKDMWIYDHAGQVSTHRIEELYKTSEIEIIVGEND